MSPSVKMVCLWYDCVWQSSLGCIRLYFYFVDVWMRKEHVAWSDDFVYILFFLELSVDVGWVCGGKIAWQFFCCCYFMSYSIPTTKNKEEIHRCVLLQCCFRYHGRRKKPRRSEQKENDNETSINTLNWRRHYWRHWFHWSIYSFISIRYLAERKICVAIPSTKEALIKMSA